MTKGKATKASAIPVAPTTVVPLVPFREEREEKGAEPRPNQADQDENHRAQDDRHPRLRQEDVIHAGLHSARLWLPRGHPSLRAAVKEG
jgi:hypothetical protein